MRSISLLLLISFIASVTACVANDDDSSSASVSALEDPCQADKVDFKNYDGAKTCAKSNPGMFQTAVGAIVKAGGTCTVQDKTQACTSIEPIKDETTQRISWWPIRCSRFCPGDPIAGLGFCTVECCVDGVNGEICFKNDHVAQ